jgi:hypothetical protein
MNLKRRKLCASSIGAALLAAGLLCAEIFLASFADADPEIPHVGQPCNEPSKVVAMGRSLAPSGPYLICAGTRWAPVGVDVRLDTTEPQSIGAPCNVPVEFQAFGMDWSITDPDAPGAGMYLVMCLHSKWTPYRP